MKNKVYVWVYALSMVSALANGYFAYKDGNYDAAFAWFISFGLASGALGAHLEIAEKEKEIDENEKEKYFK